MQAITDNLVLQMVALEVKRKKSEFDAASILQCPPAIRILHVTMILDLNDQISNKDHMRLKI